MKKSPDVYNAILINVLRDIMARDSSISMQRLLLHIQGQYTLKITELELEQILKDNAFIAEQYKVK